MKFEIDPNEWAIEDASFQLKINEGEKSEENEGASPPGGDPTAQTASTTSSECDCSSSHPTECSPGIDSDQYDPLNAEVITSATCLMPLEDMATECPASLQTNDDNEKIDIIVSGPECEHHNPPSFSDKMTSHIAQQIERSCSVQKMRELVERQQAIWSEMVGELSYNIDMQVPDSLVDSPEPVQSTALLTADMKQLQRKKLGRTRPLSAYNMFFKQERARIVGTFETSGSTSKQEKKKRRKHPHNKISFVELGRMIGRRWKRLSKEERAVYEADAKADKMQFEAEKALLLYQMQNEPGTLMDTQKYDNCSS